MPEIETQLIKKVRFEMFGEEQLTVETFSPARGDFQSETKTVLQLDPVPYGKQWDVLVHVEIRELDGE